jgi:hypothetical protein
VAPLACSVTSLLMPRALVQQQGAGLWIFLPFERRIVTFFLRGSWAQAICNLSLVPMSASGHYAPQPRSRADIVCDVYDTWLFRGGESWHEWKSVLYFYVLLACRKFWFSAPGGARPEPDRCLRPRHQPRQPDGSFLFHDTIYDTAIHLQETSALAVAAGWLFHFVSTSPRLGLGTHVWAVTTRQTVSIACGRGHVMRMLRMSASGR